MSRGRADSTAASGIRHDGDKMLTPALRGSWNEGASEELKDWEQSLVGAGHTLLEDKTPRQALAALMNLREFGSKEHHQWDESVTPGSINMLEAAQDWFPTQWLIRSHSWSETLPIQVWLDEKESFTLAAYTHEDPMGGSGFYITRRLMRGPTQARAVILHEWAHRMEALTPDIKTAAWAFRQRRADNPVAHEYAWKTYGDAGPDRHSELFASGIEALAGGTDAEILLDDKDYCAWLLGVLATV